MTNTLDINDDKKMERSMSSSPEIGRDRKHSAPEIPLGHIVRVTTTEHDHCNYKCLLVNHIYAEIAEKALEIPRA